MTVPKLKIDPPLINTPCPAATTLEDLIALWNCPSTGAITTRTSLTTGFPHDDAKNLYVFYDSSSHAVSSTTNPSPSQTTSTQNATLNSLGYSPIHFTTYLTYINIVVDRYPPPNSRSSKTIIISVTGTASEVAMCYSAIARLQQSNISFSSSNISLAMEINLSCPNIPHHPPPAYSREALTQYLNELAEAVRFDTVQQGLPRIPVGLKTPPYTYETQFLELMEALEASAIRSKKGKALEADVDDEGEKESWSLVEEVGAMKVAEEKAERKEEEELECPISFITATNTLGSCLAFTGDGSEGEGALPTELGIGGLAGAPLHPLALGNVMTLRKMLDEREEKLGHRVQVIGVGGVLDTAGYKRMRKAGADVVGLASGLLLKGTEVFGEIERGLGKDGW